MAAATCERAGVMRASKTFSTSKPSPSICTPNPHILAGIPPRNLANNPLHFQYENKSSSWSRSAEGSKFAIGPKFANYSERRGGIGCGRGSGWAVDVETLQIFEMDSTDGRKALVQLAILMQYLDRNQREGMSWHWLIAH